MPRQIILERLPAVVIAAIIGFIGVFSGGIFWLLASGVFEPPVAVNFQRSPAFLVAATSFEGPVWKLKAGVEHIGREHPHARVAIIHSKSPLKMRLISMECKFGPVESNRFPVENISQGEGLRIAPRSIICVAFKGRSVYWGVRARKIALDYIKHTLKDKYQLDENERYEIWERADLNAGMEIWFPVKN